MSNILPSATIKALRKSHNVVLDVYGIDVTLFLVTNLDSIENLDAYQTVEDRTYNEVATKAFIEWKPNQYRLRKLGLYTEDELPIICHLPNSLGNIPIGSYLVVPITYLPDDAGDTDQFEIVNQAMPNLHDQEPFLTYRITPKRKPQ